MMNLPSAIRSATARTAAVWLLCFAVPAAVAAPGDQAVVCAAALNAKDVKTARSACANALAAAQKPANGAQPDALTLAQAYDAAGHFYSLIEKADQAEAHYRAAYPLWSKAKGANHPLVAASLAKIAEMQMLQNKLAEAEPVLLRAQEILDKSSGARSADAAAARHSLGMLYYRMGKAGKAESLFRQEIAILEEVAGPAHPATAVAYNNLGFLLHSNGKLPEASALYHKAIAALEKAGAADQPKLYDPLLNLATLLDSLGRPFDAEKLLQRALALREKLDGGSPSLAVADIRNRLGVLYQKAQSVDIAEKELRSALDTREKLLGINHLLVAESCSNLGILLMQQGRLGDALPLLRHAAAVTQAQLGPQNELSKTRWDSLEQLYQAILRQPATDASKNGKTPSRR